MDPMGQPHTRYVSGLAITALVVGLFSLCLTPLGLVALGLVLRWCRRTQRVLLQARLA